MDIIAAIIAVLIPAIATYLAVQVAKVSAYVDSLPGLIKQFVVVAVAAAAAFVSQKLGISLPGDLGGFNAEVVQGLLAALAAMLLHRQIAPK